MLLHTSYKGITGHAGWTAADGVMVDNLAASVDTASARAGVDTLLLDTCFVLGTVGADHALGPAGGRRAYEPGETRADGVTVHFTALTVGTTRRRLTRVLWRLSYRGEETETVE